MNLGIYNVNTVRVMQYELSGIPHYSKYVINCFYYSNSFPTFHFLIELYILFSYKKFFSRNKGFSVCNIPRNNLFSKLRVIQFERNVCKCPVLEGSIRKKWETYHRMFEKPFENIRRCRSLFSLFLSKHICTHVALYTYTTYICFA